ncbi:hypothetical protein B0H16DRAFT_1529417 [Mycena metata]|uniref:Uncharacterized protein n=1 Tax=Mycena metata TaxID=1033252 RepID=A0AAD7JEB1_9AGAR|nr:hypothetical protein B0H16DRAFT_1529417 [Mycena metata]
MNTIQFKKVERDSSKLLLLAATLNSGLVHMRSVRGPFQRLARSQRVRSHRLGAACLCIRRSGGGGGGGFGGIFGKVLFLGLRRHSHGTEDHERFTRFVDLVLLLAREFPLRSGAAIFFDILVESLLHVGDEMKFDYLRLDGSSARINQRKMLEEDALCLIQCFVCASAHGGKRGAANAIVEVVPEWICAHSDSVRVHPVVAKHEWGIVGW